MLRRTLLAAALALVVPAAALAAEPRWAPINEALDPYVERGELAGMITLARHKGRVVHASAVGERDLASGAPMRMDTIVRAFSMTKPVTAVAMGVLRDEGKWKPEDPIAKFLPELAGLKVFKGMGPDGKPILEAPTSPPTVGQIMTHTAGFAYGFEAGYVEDLYRANPPMRGQSSAEVIQKIAALPLDYEPGARWKYSIAMDVQGLIIERITGRSLPDFMQARIFGPLKMVDTGFHVPVGKRDRFAALYEWKDGKLQPPSADGLFSSTYDRTPGFASGGGGLVTTASDYGRFGQMLLNGGTLDGVRILKRETAREIMTAHLPPQIVTGGFGIGSIQRIRPGYEYGYNGVVITDPGAAKVAMGKGSYLWDGAAGTWFWVDPENQIVFVGLVQRLMGMGFPPLQPVSQEAVKRSLAADK
ncbi:serine hydrolase domain-containing protein [Phenylobacterium sp.]|uniref:serine hydrolase domain-containing protein n=1 Tax=Phenylobacterium sp. TaxID=1871053 RepID=UPI002EDAFD00